MTILHESLSPNGDAILDFLVGVSARRARLLRRAGQPVPAPVPLRGVLDTGADCTCVDPHFLRVLALTQVGNIPVHSASTGGTPVATNQYDVALWVAHPLLRNGRKRLAKSLRVLEFNLITQGRGEALIGKDILLRLRFYYNGRGGRFWLKV
jgi:hypothetical protein